MNDMQFIQKIITPEEAKELLKNNVRNRSVSRALVKKYAKMMLDGEWYFTHQSIALDEKGVLIDGQHRLLACIESKVPFNSVIVNNAKQSPYLDMGKNRNWCDNLNISTDSMKYTKSMAQIYNLLSIIAKKQKMDQAFRQKFCDYYYFQMNNSNELYKPSKIRSGGCPMLTAIFLNLVINNNTDNIYEKIRNYINIFNHGICNTNSIVEMQVKQMRDNYLAGKREFSKLAANTSNTNIRLIKTLYFTKSLHSYLTNSRYNYGVYKTEQFQVEVERLFVYVYELN